MFRDKPILRFSRWSIFNRCLDFFKKGKRIVHNSSFLEGEGAQKKRDVRTEAGFVMRRIFSTKSAVDAYWQLAEDSSGVLCLNFNPQNEGDNRLSWLAIEALHDILDVLEKNPPQRLILCQRSIGDRPTFMTSMSINDWALLTDESDVNTMICFAYEAFDRFENLPCRKVALIDGECSGTGLEFVLRCDHRVMVDWPAARMTWGVLSLNLPPVLGGMKRLIQCLGTRVAFDLLLSEKCLDTSQAYALGLVDEKVLPAFSLQVAKGVNVELARLSSPKIWCARWHARKLRRFIMCASKQSNMSLALTMLDVWLVSQGDWVMPTQAEWLSWSRLVLRNEAVCARQYTEHLHHRLQALGEHYIWSGRHIHVIGFGSDVEKFARQCLLQGFWITLQTAVNDVGETSVEAWQVFGDLLMEYWDRFIPDETGDGIENADVIFVLGGGDLVQRALRHVEQSAKADSLLLVKAPRYALCATLLNGTTQPERWVGVHLHTGVGAHECLVELMRMPITSVQQLFKAGALMRCLRHISLPVQDQVGGIVSRILAPYLLEAVHLYNEGQPVDEIESAGCALGFLMGPLASIDRLGLDAWAIETSAILSIDTCFDNMPARLLTQQLGCNKKEGFLKWRASQRRSKRGLPQSIMGSTSYGRLQSALYQSIQSCVQAGFVADTDLCDAALIWGGGFDSERGGFGYVCRRSGFERMDHFVSAVTSTGL